MLLEKQNEVSYDRCANALDCYKKLRTTLSRNGEQRKNKRLLDYEEFGDVKLLQNRIFCTSSTYIGFATEKKEEYDEMMGNAEHNHIVFTDRSNIPDMKRIDGTQKISQVESIKGSSIDDHWKFTTSYLPCSCINCRRTCSSDTCLYRNVRNIEKQEVREEKDNSVDDPYGMRSLTCVQLRFQLRERGLQVGGTKQVLVSRLLPILIEENL